MKENKIKKIIKFIYVFLIIGLESLGNMSAVTAVLQENLIKKNKMVTEEDIIDAVTLSRLGPGATTSNMVAFLGNRIAGFWGGALATICYTICPLIVIVLIYSFIEQLLEYSFISSALRGGLIYIGVMFINSSVDMGKSVLKNNINLFIFGISLIASLIFNVSCIYIIICVIIFGIIKLLYDKRIVNKNRI